MLRGVSPRAVLVVSFSLLLLGCAIQCLDGWGGAPEPIATLLRGYFLVFGTVRNGLFEGFFYVAVGMLLGISSSKGKGAWPLTTVLPCLAVGLVGSVFVSPDAHLPFAGLLAVSVFCV